MVGIHRPYEDFQTEVFDCGECGCRFTGRDETVYERLHNTQGSSYASHRPLAEGSRRLFAVKDLAGLRQFLGRVAKNEFVMRSLEGLPPKAHVLEIGSAGGYLLAYFIARGYTALGIDISPTAVESARRNFGDHFGLPDDPRLHANAAYDAIFHVGTIGCVEDPVKLTSDLLSLLKPGGTLAFNAPNRQVCDVYQRTWIFDTHPPDLVTLFPPAFWEERFSDRAAVVTEIAFDPGARTLMYKFFPEISAGPRGRLFETGDSLPLKRITKKVLWNLSRLAARLLLVKKTPAEFGIHVSMTKR